MLAQLYCKMEETKDSGILKADVEHADSANDSASAHFEIEEHALPPGYFRSRFFIGSMTGIGLGLMAGVAGFAYAAPILSIINADIGPVCDL